MFPSLWNFYNISLSVSDCNIQIISKCMELINFKAQCNPKCLCYLLFFERVELIKYVDQGGLGGGVIISTLLSI